jgi:hypothetical protein
MLTMDSLYSDLYDPLSFDVSNKVWRGFDVTLLLSVAPWSTCNPGASARIPQHSDPAINLYSEFRWELSRKLSGPDPSRVGRLGS